MKKALGLDPNFFPKSLLHFTQNKLGSQFTNLPYLFQTGYVNIFWSNNQIIRHNKHNRDPNSFPLSREKILANFTNHKDFNAVNKNGYYLVPKRSKWGVVEGKYNIYRNDKKGGDYQEPTGWLIRTVDAFPTYREGGVRGANSGYQLSPQIQEMIEDWFELSDDELGYDKGFINYQGQTPKDFEIEYEGAIRRHLSTIPQTININLEVKINREQLNEHLKINNTIKQYLGEVKKVRIKLGSKQLEEVGSRIEGREESKQQHRQRPGGVNRQLPTQSLLSKDITLVGIKQRISEIKYLKAMARETQSDFIPLTYKEVSTGRYTTNNLTIQGFHRSVRYASLSGCYEYDLEAAHQNILIQLLQDTDIDMSEIQVLTDYVNNKQIIREMLASAIETTVPIIKEIIQELTYGGQLSRSNKVALFDVCNQDRELINRVCSNGWMKQYRDIFKLASDYLVKDKEEIINGVGIPFAKNTNAQALAHILQGYERQVLDAIIKHSNKDDIALLLHDCVVFYNRQDPKHLSDIVQKETGFTLQFSEELY